jgi:TonB family protein
MLDKLVISKNQRNENKKIGRIFVTASTVVVGGFIFALVSSLFAHTPMLGREGLLLSELIAPVSLPADKPTPPEPLKSKKKAVETISRKDLPTRKQNIMRPDESPTEIPKTVSNIPSEYKSRPLGEYTIGSEDSDASLSGSALKTSGNKNGPVGGGFDQGDRGGAAEKKDPPVKKDPPKPPPPVVAEKKKTPVVVTKGVVNGEAKNLVKPSYPAAAKAMQLRGKVTVQILIDENGRVTSAQAVDGHRLFYQQAVAAARKSVFSPTLLSGEKVKVRGMIVYNFN